MKKKTIAIMMTAAMVMAMAAGCGSKESSSSDGDNKRSKLQDWYSAVCRARITG